MDNEMIERVAKAIEYEFNKLNDYANANGFMDNFAIAAIKAMREPTEKMKLVGASCLPDYEPQVDDAEECWKNMIDSILND